MSVINIMQEIRELSSDIDGTQRLIDELIKQNREKIKERDRLRMDFKMQTTKSGRRGAKHKDIY